MDVRHRGAVPKGTPRRRLHLLGQTVMLATTAVGLCACNGSPDPISVSTSDASKVSAGQTLQNRPLHLPAIPANAACPVSAETNLPTAGVRVNGGLVPDYGYGRGPVYLSGQLVWYAGVYAMFVVSPEYGGPVLARGHRLDQDGSFPFSSPLVLPEAQGTKAWRIFGSSINDRVAPGCYGVQVDGSNFSDVIVFVIRSGRPPAG